MNKGFLYSIGLSITILLSGCGGGGGGEDTTTSSTTTTANAGVFIDSKVSGLEYVGNLGTTGETDSLGRFYFKDGEIITFKIENVILGEAQPEPNDFIVTPQKILEYKLKQPVDANDTKVIRMVQFLISADIDGDPANGITISDETKQLLKQKLPIRFDEEDDINESVIKTYLEKDTIATEDEALSHYEESLIEIEKEKDELEREVEEFEEDYDEEKYTTTTTSSTEYQLLAWNDLGMHCMDGNDYSVFSILPPYNTLVAQLIKKGDKTAELVTSGVIVTYEAAVSFDGKYNTTSSDKTNFWDYVSKLFGINLQPDTGLKGKPVQSLSPVNMDFNSTYKWWIAEGIPTAPKNDDGSVNHYPMVKVVAKDLAGNILAETTTVLPVSDEMDCKKCHSSTSGYDAAKPKNGWVELTEPEKDYKFNILRLHDEKFPNAVLEHNISLSAKGWNYNINGLEETVKEGTPVLCASCHKSNALPGTGIDNISPLTQAIHAKHSKVIDPDTNLSLNDSLNRNACYTCHPGSTTQCLRGAMGKAKNPDGTNLIECQSCHGVMSAVGSSTREGWLDEPDCQSCHQNGKRYTEAVTDMLTGTLRTTLDSRFATNPDTPIQGKSLYRFSKGHGGLQCSACHGSTHAIYPSSRPEDNAQSIAAQGHAGTIAECTACHLTVPDTVNGGPHGLHTVGQAWIENHEDAAKNNLLSCSTCHGSDYRGSELSKTFSARTFHIEDGQTKTFAAGHKISCYDCHNGPYGENEVDDD
ncbi:multiheme c-type cytochrome [Nitrosophilus labii]|uniref:multiheme c-type cytochrome n=1 Tax=Nitrosophilus labii TaxID=2706014 RepID=UPI0018D92834|nr:multiheme c-type cytochrome [Nitrosophilus labii]